jgi:ATP-independent RNA helicase DbpA
MNATDSESFSTLKLAPAQLANLANLGYDRMTAIQAASLPLILQGKDLVAQAKTGSGKTAAFGLGLLEQVNPKHFAVQAMVLCPTRELADQVGKELRRLAQGISNIKLISLCGGKPFGPQKLSLQHGAHIVVGTPGRILDHLTKSTLKLADLKVLVLDEADRMLDMGFSDAMRDIVAHAPRQRQTLLFSATYPDSIKTISASLQRDPVRVTAEAEHQPGTIEALFYEVKRHERNSTLIRLFEHYHPSAALVFCHTKIQCAEVATLLNEHNIQALALHGDLEQRQRDRVLVRFANASAPVLVATDVAARGLDIKALPLVINYELPRDPEVYTHRIGRTGRAGESGIALSLFTESEQARLNAIESATGEPCICDVSDSLDHQENYKLYAEMTTIEFAAGRKQKIRAGDLLGALTRDAGLEGSDVGKIDIFDMCSFVALKNASVRTALSSLSDGKVKGRNIRARKLN